MLLQQKIDDVLESVHLGDLLVDERDGTRSASGFRFSRV